MDFVKISTLLNYVMYNRHPSPVKGLENLLLLLYSKIFNHFYVKDHHILHQNHDTET